MPPKTSKTKKTAEISEAPKKGRGKTKNIEEVEPEAEVDDEAAPVTEKKKRGKKVAGDMNGVEENGTAIAPPAKKGRKKNIEEPSPEEKQDEDSVNGDTAEKDDADTNGDEKEPDSSKGRKKSGKKDPAPEKSKAGRGRKPKSEKENKTDENVKDEEDQKPKPAGRGRGKKASKDIDEDIGEKPEPASKGRKKAQPKAVKEKTPESDKAEEGIEEKKEKAQPKKKETKGRKGKKAQAKEDSEEPEEEPADEPIEEIPAAKKRKVTKKDEKGKGDSKDEEADEEQPEPKAKGKRGQKKAAEDKTGDDGDAQEADSTTKRRRKPEDKAPKVDKKKPAPKNKTLTNFEELDFSNQSQSKDGKVWNFKIASWNVDGIRAWMSKGGLDYLKFEKPDILCLQETKCSEDKLPEELKHVPGYHAYWLCSEQDGYAGVAIYTTQLAINVQNGLLNEELDAEGRIITAEYEQFYLVCTYVPNAGRKLVTMPKRLQWNEEFRKHVKELDKKKPVIICGDMNVSHSEIDLANPKTNRKNAGFTDEERAGMTELLGDGFTDTFRHLYPDTTGAYTFWTYMSNSRAKNVGWRLDYFIVSERLLPAVCDNVIRSEVYGSDHCPISLFLHLKGADKPKE